MMIANDVRIKFTQTDVQLVIVTDIGSLTQEFPFGNYNSPYEISRAVVEAVQQYAIEMGTIMPEDMEYNIRRVFEETEYDIVEEMILYNRPMGIIH